MKADNKILKGHKETKNLSRSALKYAHLKSSLFHRVFHRGEEYDIRGRESESFHRRTYELPIENLHHVTRSNLGFSNCILM
jgi:hypothetical protein